MGYLPTEIEKKEVKRVSKDISLEVKSRLSRYNPKVTVVGSTAKGTFVSGDTDIDVYIITPEYEDAFSRAKEIYDQGHRKRGELTIWNFDREGYDVDLVFIPPDYEKVDTLKHTGFFDKRLSNEQKKDVVRGKALFKSEGVYGAEVGGIVGVAIEELVRKEDDLKGACRYLIKNDRSEAWLQDPVLDKPRNLLASISRKRYRMIQDICKKYLKTGKIDFKAYDFDDFVKDFEDMEILVFDRKFDRAVDYHTSVAMCKKAGRIVRGKADDVETSCEAFIGKDRIGIAFDAEPKKLPEKREECIPKHMDSAIEAFKEKHPDVESYVRGEEFCALVKRKVTRPLARMREKIKRLMGERKYSYKTLHSSYQEGSEGEKVGMTKEELENLESMDIPEGYEKTVRILRKAGISFNVEKLGKNVKEKDTILSSRTAKDWNVWHCTREIVQNALDEHSEMEIERPPKISRPSPQILKIRDFGNGLRKEDIIYNRPVKGEEETLRGMYGTGFKRAFIRFLEGYNITPLLISTDYSIVNQRFEPFGKEETWSFTIENGLRFSGGTIALIEGDSKLIEGALDSIRHKVLGLPISIYDWKKFSVDGGLVINKETGEYVSRINFLMRLFVEERDSIFGYNFLDKKMPSDDSRTSFTDWKFNSSMGRIILKFDERPIIEKTIRHVLRHNEEVAEEDVAFPTFDLEEKIAEPDMWKDSWLSVFSEKHVVLTNPAATEEVVRRGYRPVKVPSDDWKRLLEACGVMTDMDVIGPEDWEAKTVKPTTEQKEVLLGALKFLDPFYRENLREKFPSLVQNVYEKIILYTKDDRLKHDIEVVRGFIPFGGPIEKIHIAQDRLDEGFWPAVGTLLHELGHSGEVEGGGGPDESRKFENYLRNKSLAVGRRLDKVSEMGLEAGLPEEVGKLPGSKMEYVMNRLQEQGVDTGDMTTGEMLSVFLAQTTKKGALGGVPIKKKVSLKKWGIARKKIESEEEKRKRIKWGVSKEGEEKWE